MRRHHDGAARVWRLGLAALLCAGGIGCDVTRDPPLEGDALAWANRATAERWRYARFVTRCEGRTLADCRLAPPWRSRRLFTGTAALPAPDEAGPTFWVHEWRNEQTPDDAARGLMALGDGAPISPPRLQPMADLESLRAASASAWRAPAGAVAGGAAGRATRVVVLDTVPRGLSDTGAGFVRDGGHAHGADMARIVRQAACNGAVQCAVTVETALALDLVPGRLAGGSRLGDPALGGAYGDPGSLAAAIHSATARWLAADDGSHLVLLIAAGWTPTPGDPGAEAVQQALAQARCWGAVIVAAYGNAADGPGDAGRVPRGALCAADTACAAEDGLLLAVAGAQPLPDGTLGPLPSGRDPGTVAPDLFAYGHLVRPAGGAAAWTGSSVGAALAAAAVATAWAALPDATGVEGADAVQAGVRADAAAHAGYLAPCVSAGEACQVGSLAGDRVPAPGNCTAATCPEQAEAGAGALTTADGVAADPVCDVCVLSGDTVVLAARTLPQDDPEETLTALALKITRGDGKVDRYPLAEGPLTRAELARTPLELRLADVRAAGPVRAAELVGLVSWRHPDREATGPRVRSLREAVFVTP